MHTLEVSYYAIYAVIKIILIPIHLLHSLLSGTWYFATFSYRQHHQTAKETHKQSKRCRQKGRSLGGLFPNFLLHRLLLFPLYSFLLQPLMMPLIMFLLLVDCVQRTFLPHIQADFCNRIIVCGANVQHRYLLCCHPSAKCDFSYERTHNEFIAFYQCALLWHTFVSRLLSLRWLSRILTPMYSPKKVFGFGAKSRTLT